MYFGWVAGGDPRAGDKTMDGVGRAIIQLVNDEVKNDRFHWRDRVVEHNDNVADLQVLVIAMSVSPAKKRIGSEVSVLVGRDHARYIDVRRKLQAGLLVSFKGSERTARLIFIDEEACWPWANGEAAG